MIAASASATAGRPGTPAAGTPRRPAGPRPATGRVRRLEVPQPRDKGGPQQDRRPEAARPAPVRVQQRPAVRGAEPARRVQGLPERHVVDALGEDRLEVGRLGAVTARGTAGSRTARTRRRDGRRRRCAPGVGTWRHGGASAPASVRRDRTMVRGAAGTMRRWSGAVRLGEDAVAAPRTLCHPESESRATRPDRRPRDPPAARCRCPPRPRPRPRRPRS